jgi:hypothetical protein
MDVNIKQNDLQYGEVGEEKKKIRRKERGEKLKKWNRENYWRQEKKIKKKRRRWKSKN